MRKNLKSIIFTAAIAASLTACSSNNSSSAVTGSSSDAGSSQAENTIQISENAEYSVFLAYENEFMKNYEILCYDKDTGTVLQFITEVHMSKTSAYSENDIKETENEIANMGMSDFTTVTLTALDDIYCVKVVYADLQNTENADLLYKNSLLPGTKTELESGGYDADPIITGFLDAGYTQLDDSGIEKAGLHFKG